MHLHSFHRGSNHEGDDETEPKEGHHQNQSLGEFNLQFIFNI